MCNRCDGGNKPIVKMKCNNCSFVFYAVKDDHEHEHELEHDVSLCPKCMEGKGVLVDDME